MPEKGDTNDVYISVGDLDLDDPPPIDPVKQFFPEEERTFKPPRRKFPLGFVIAVLAALAIAVLLLWGMYRLTMDTFEGGQGYGWTHSDYLYGYSPQRPAGCLSGSAAAWYACNARCAENPMGMSNSRCMDACLEARGRGEELAAAPADPCVGGRCQA